MDETLKGFLSCHVCSEMFSDPVSLSCNHSFCSTCLQDFWKQANNKNCPICKRRSSKETPLVDFKLKQLVDIHSKRQNTVTVEAAEKVKVCSKHPDDPRLFCKDEQRAVCLVCDFPHQPGHTVIPIEQAVCDLKEELKPDLKSVQDKRDKYKQAEKTYSDMLQHTKKQVNTTEEQIKAEFEKLHQFLREEEESRLAALRDEEQVKKKTLSEKTKVIERQVSCLSDTISDVEQELQKDPVSFLSSYKVIQDKARELCLLPDPQLVSGGLIDQAKHLGNLAFRVWEKMKQAVRFTPVILDPNTADSCLSLSDDLTSVRQVAEWSRLPDNPERNTKYATVFGCEGFISGEHSWVVEVGDHPDWNIGVVKESLDRKGELLASPRYGIWCLLHDRGKYNNGTGETLTVKRRPQKIRIQLVYRKGEVSFYDPEDNTHLYTHKNTFTEKLFPYFCVGDAGDAKTVDIKVCQADRPLRRYWEDVCVSS